MIILELIDLKSTLGDYCEINYCEFNVTYNFSINTYIIIIYNVS